MADVSTEVAIATQTLGSAASSITFNSIPATYTDLRVVLTGSWTTADRPKINFNSDYGTNYSRTLLLGDGTDALSYQTSNFTTIFVGATQYLTYLATFDVFSYAGSTYKTLLATRSADMNGSGEVDNLVGLWRSTSAITRIDLAGIGGNTFAAGTTATLYGIL
jgi:hypothetical protein